MQFTWHIWMIFWRNKVEPLLGFKDIIIDGDVCWGTVGSPEWKFNGLIVDNSDVNSQVFRVGTSDGATLGLIDNTMLSVADYSKLGK